jgi:phage shock protein PspC (stress-responsive transcriptional regulator)
MSSFAILMCGAWGGAVLGYFIAALCWTARDDRRDNHEDE